MKEIEKLKKYEGSIELKKCIILTAKNGKRYVWCGDDWFVSSKRYGGGN